MAAAAGAPRKLAPGVNRIVVCKNLPFNITGEELYDLFGRYGPIRQIRLGNAKDTKGRAFVVYEDIYDAKNAVDHLSGFNIRGRFLVVLYHHPDKKPVAPAAAAASLEARKEKVEQMKRKLGGDV